MSWVGELPTGWKLLSLKHLARILNGATPKSGVEEFWGGDVNWFTPTDLDNNQVTFLAESNRKLTRSGLDSCAAQLAPPDSIVISSRAPVGSVGITTVVSATNQGCRTLVPTNGFPSKLLAAALLSARDQLQIVSNGTTFLELSTRSLADFKLPVPPADQWPLLLSHLDRKTARIDALVAKKTRFIELLREKRQALVTQAVTKGLDVSVPLKDRGIDWIGVTPSTWAVHRLGYYFEERRVKVSDKDFAPLSVTNKGVVPQLENVAKSDDSDNRKLVRAGDFVINSRSDRKGSGGIAPRDGSVSLINTVLTAQRGMRKEFAAYLLTSYPFQEEFYRVGNGIVADMWTTKYAEMKNIRLAVPELAEQDSIVSYLDFETARIDTLIAKTKRSIELLREYRITLITAAVTGKIDLRDVT